MWRMRMAIGYRFLGDDLGDDMGAPNKLVDDI
jgi:hypothetical protein